MVEHEPLLSETRPPVLEWSSLFFHLFLLANFHAFHQAFLNRCYKYRRKYCWHVICMRLETTFDLPLFVIPQPCKRSLILQLENCWMWIIKLAINLSGRHYINNWSRQATKIGHIYKGVSCSYIIHRHRLWNPSIGGTVLVHPTVALAFKDTSAPTCFRPRIRNIYMYTGSWYFLSSKICQQKCKKIMMIMMIMHKTD